MKRRTAFTLIELLVVISVVALLMSILMPSLNRAREQAKRLVCKTNLKTHHLSASLYAMDNNDKLSVPTRVGVEEVDEVSRNWHIRYLHYTETPEVFGCPSFNPRKLAELLNNDDLLEFKVPDGYGQWSGQVFSLAYIANEFIMAGGKDVINDRVKIGREWKMHEIAGFASRDSWKGFLFGDGIYRINFNSRWTPFFYTANKMVAAGQLNPRPELWWTSETGVATHRGDYRHMHTANFILGDGSIGHQTDEFVYNVWWDPKNTGEAKMLRPSMLVR